MRRLRFLTVAVAAVELYVRQIIMSNILQQQAVQGLAELHDAALRIDWSYVAEWIMRAKNTIESDHSTGEENLQEVIGVCSGLSRGEWDRSLVDPGGLPYRSLFEIPLILYRYCEALELEPQRLRFVRDQIERYHHNLDNQKA